MYYPFRNSFVVKMKDFLPEMEIFHGGWAASADFERIMIIDYGSTLGGGQNRETIFSRLMQFPAFAPMQEFGRELCLLLSSFDFDDFAMIGPLFEINFEIDQPGKPGERKWGG